MIGVSQSDRAKKAEYLDILDETIRTNPYRKAQSAMVSVMSKHGIKSNTGSNTPGKPGPTGGKPSEKKCALSRSLRLAQNCDEKLNKVKEDLQGLCCQLQATANSAEEKRDASSDKAVMAGHLLTLIGEAETISKRIYETAVGLHIAEDFLRQPEDLKLLDFSSNGRIQIPNYNFNHASQLCLEWLYSTASKWLRGFKEKSYEENAQFIDIFENFTKAIKDYTDAVCLANQVFRVLLYSNTLGKSSLQEYVVALGHVFKNDLIMEVQCLRRTLDNIQYTFERIGWAASIAWMKYSGENITIETLNETGIQVDRSIFQHKFYEGPPKPGKRASSAGGIKKAKPAGKESGSKASIRKKSSSSNRSTSAGTDDVGIPQDFMNAGNMKESSSPKAKSEHSKNAAKISEGKRLSSTNSEVSVNKGFVKSKSVKGKKSGASSVKAAESFSVDTEFLHLPSNPKEKSGHVIKPTSSESQLSLFSVQKIPPGLQEQFNAVFGKGSISPQKKNIPNVKGRPRNLRPDIGKAKDSGSKQSVKGQKQNKIM